jgi:hypothetical protein
MRQATRGSQGSSDHQATHGARHGAGAADHLSKRLEGPVQFRLRLGFLDRLR